MICLMIASHEKFYIATIKCLFILTFYYSLGTQSRCTAQNSHISWNRTICPPYYYLIAFFFQVPFFPHDTVQQYQKPQAKCEPHTLKYQGDEVPSSSSIHYLQIRCFSFLANTGSGSGYLYLSLKQSKWGKSIRCQNTWSVSLWSGSKSRLNFEYNVLVQFSGPLKREKLKFTNM